MTNAIGDISAICAEILDTCAVSNLRKLSRLTTSYFNEKIKPTGLKTTQICVLLALGRNPGRPMSAYAEELGMDLSTLARSIDTLKKVGLVTLKSGNRRERLVSLSEAGEHKINEVYPYWQEAQEEFIASFGEDQWNMYLNVVAGGI